ncbi:hypothetical protein Asulf_00841 [Archaeoglobus sulfaticallidus PM70-1]|uniref:Uncharacterized protein n=1 Tax=Archaeoglobus sulfaticallidus PM70-1 TaxID=387631 RepID=N0BB64_9EURY|nr:hypothetical protein [Archaeoglobus sulfaticallidus]AGK60849.1 hypothetical protein Asulf_00841 [Archaeoglobus sulfaticallidus PM70-1]
MGVLTLRVHFKNLSAEAELLEKARVIKIGSKDRISFGELLQVHRPRCNVHRKFVEVVKWDDYEG